MHDYCDKFDFDYLGFNFRAYIVADDNNRRPWEDCDGHGPVREDLRESKKPGEKILGPSGSRDVWYLYDWQAAQREALRDGWGAKDSHQPGETRRQYAARAVQADFDFLRGWCCDHWHYVGVCVARLDDDGEECEDPYVYALWGIESNAGDYLREVAAENAHQCLSDAGLLPEQRRAAWHKALREARERKQWAARGVLTVGA